MRLIKMFGLAAIAVGAFMAFLGATSASAVSILEEVVNCKTLEDPCAAGNSFGSGTKIDAKNIGTPTLLGLKNITCTTSTVSGESSGTLAHGLITALHWLGCEAEGESCEVKALNLPYLVKVLLADNHTNYHQIVEKHAKGAGRPSSLVACEDGTDCRYGEDVILFDVAHSGTSGLVVLTVSQKLKGEGICFFTSGIWEAKYEVKCLSGSSEVGCWPAMEAGKTL